MIGRDDKCSKLKINSEKNITHFYFFRVQMNIAEKKECVAIGKSYLYNREKVNLKQLFTDHFYNRYNHFF